MKEDKLMKLIKMMVDLSKTQMMNRQSTYATDKIIEKLAEKLFMLDSGSEKAQDMESEGK